jgi:hypothetical protein
MQGRELLQERLVWQTICLNNGHVNIAVINVFFFFRIQTRYTTSSTSFSLLEAVVTTPTTPICDGLSFVPNCDFVLYCNGLFVNCDDVFVNCDVVNYLWTVTHFGKLQCGCEEAWYSVCNSVFNFSVILLWLYCWWICYFCIFSKKTLKLLISAPTWGRRK